MLTRGAPTSASWPKLSMTRPRASARSAPASKSRRIVAISEAGSKRKVDRLAVEEPLEVRVNTRSISITMRTPGHDPELAAGFLVTEGLIHKRGDIQDIRSYSRNEQGNVVDVFLSPGTKVDFARLTRHVFASSSCGLCGKASIDAIHQQFKPVRNATHVRSADLTKIAADLTSLQQTFAQTGGLHAAAIYSATGRLVVVREDVGRHNAVDKVIGHGLLEDLLPFNKHILLVSGRASFEIMQKALAAGIPVVAAISAPSSLAVEFAQASGQTLIGFLRPGRMNVYAHGERVRN
jgi:FdhD protein